MQAGGGRYVDDNFVWFCAGTQVNGEGADEAEGGSGVAVEPEENGERDDRGVRKVVDSHSGKL